MQKENDYLKQLEDPKVRKAIASNDIVIFAQYYLANHIEMEMTDFHEEWADVMVNRKKVGIAAPRGHAKSTWFTLVYPLWCILFGKKKFIVLISDSSTQSELFLGTIIEELETNDTIIRDFGNIAGYISPVAKEKKKWTARDIITSTNVKVIARGWNSRIRGVRYQAKRPDLVILDDVENDENVHSEDQRLKVKNTFGKSIMNLGYKDTQYLVIGTILHFDSLLMHIINNPGEGWYVKLYKAIRDDGSILWPERFTMKMFDEMKADPQIGTIRFAQEYQNNPLDPSQQIIKPVAFYEGNVDLTMLDCYGYIDLAISEKQTADYTAITTIGRHKQTGKLYVLDPVRIRGDITSQLDLVFLQHSKYNYVSFGVESVAYQKVFFQVAQLESEKRGIYIPLIEVEIDKDKVRRAVEVTPHIENGTVLFNASYVDYMAELIQFPKGAHDDWVDSTVGAITLALKGSGSGKVRTGGGIKFPKNY